MSIAELRRAPAARRLASLAFCFGLAFSLSAFAGLTPEQCALCWDDCNARAQLCREEGGTPGECGRERLRCVNACGCRA